jgi:hypothetical protein
MMHRRYSELNWNLEWDMVSSSFSWNFDEHFIRAQTVAPADETWLKDLPIDVRLSHPYSTYVSGSAKRPMQG